MGYTTSMIDEQLREAAIESGFSVRELTKRAGIGYASCWRFVNGEGISISTAARIADVLGLELRRKRKPRKGR